MPQNGTLTVEGLTHQQGSDGFPVAGMGGQKPSGPITDFTILWRGEGLPPNNGFITLQGLPYPGGGNFATGTDGDGAIALLRTYTISPPFDDDTRWEVTGPGAGITLVLPNGILGSLVRAVCNNTDGTREIELAWLALDVNDPGDFPGTDPPPIPQNVTGADPSWDPDEQLGTVTLTWDDVADEDGYVILRSLNGGPFEPIGNVPADITEFTDYVDEEGDYSYEIQSYTYDGGPPGGPAISDPSDPSPPVTVGGDTPDISITGSGGIDLGGTASFVFIGDPSGIYTLVPGKTHDTLYERTDVDSVDVAIPNPFIETAYVPEE